MAVLLFQARTPLKDTMTDKNTEALRNYAAELLVDIAFDTSAPNLGNDAAVHLDNYLSDPDSLQLLAMSVFRSAQHLDTRTSKLLDSAMQQFENEDSYVGAATRRIQQFMKTAGRERAAEAPQIRPAGYGAIVL